jgi:nucleoid-associated protein YgaU
VHPAGAGVIVRRGDSLWRIAAAHLPGQPTDRRIAASWPRWYAANRQVVGTDPNLITPGEVLHAPQPTRTHGSRS